MATPFTLDDIDHAHRGVTQESVRKYLTDLYDIGVVSYTTCVSDGHSGFFDVKGNRISSAAVHEPYDVSDEADRHAANQALEAHGIGKSDYFTFSKQLAVAGVYTWVMDTVKLTCTFYSKSGDLLLKEEV